MLYVPKEHSALATFPFDTEGFHIISGTDHLPIAEKKKYWWIKRVGLGDKITITPYEVENNDELPENFEKKLTAKGKSGCDTCHKKLGKDWGGSDNFYIVKRYHGQVNIGGSVIWACRDCYPAKEQEYLQNYETVWEGYLDKDNMVDYRKIKCSLIDCYAGHKDPNGKINRSFFSKALNNTEVLALTTFHFLSILLFFIYLVCQVRYQSKILYYGKCSRMIGSELSYKWNMHKKRW